MALIARLCVDDTMLGVRIMTATSRQIRVRRVQAHTVSSLSARRLMCSMTSIMAAASMTAANTPPAGHPSAGEKVRSFIVSTSMRAPAR